MHQFVNLVTTPDPDNTEVMEFLDNALRSPEPQKELNHIITTIAKYCETMDAHLRIGAISRYEDEIQSGIVPYAREMMGLFGEWFAKEFLTYFGNYREFNVKNIKMLSEVNNEERDFGVDGEAFTRNETTHPHHPDIIIPSGGKVYIQVKFSKNPKQCFTPNGVITESGYNSDGVSNLTNFTTYAYTKARMDKKVHSMRLILFTNVMGIRAKDPYENEITKELKSVHWTLEEMWGNFVEVVDYTKIQDAMYMNLDFINHLRNKLGLDRIETTVEQDHEE